MVRQTARLVFFEVLGGILFLAVVAAAILAWRLSQGPLELTAFRDDIETALENARGGRDVDIETVLLQWAPERRRLDVSATGVTFYSNAGAKAGTAERLDLELDASGLLLGQAEILGIDVFGGELDIQQVDASTWMVAGEPLPEIPAGTLPETPEQWLALVNRATLALMEAGQQSAGEVTLQFARFDELSIDVILASGEIVAEFRKARGEIQQLEDDVSLVITAEGSSAGLPEIVGLNFYTRDNFESALGNITVTGWSLEDVAERLGAPDDWIDGLDAVLEFGFAATSATGVTSLDARANARDGVVRRANIDLPVTSVDVTASYDVSSDVLNVDFAQLATDRLRGTMGIRLDDAVFTEGVRRITLDAPTLRVDAAPFFERAWRVSDVELEAVVNTVSGQLDLEELTFLASGARIRASGRAQPNPDPAPGELPASIVLAAEMTGDANKRTVLDFWPTGLGGDARRFVVNNITAATLTGATAQLRLEPNSLARGYLDDEALEIGFTARDADVRFLDDFPAITGAAGTGRLTGNSFSVDVVRGNWSSWVLDTGRVDVPVLNPRGGDMIITASGRGPVRDAVSHIFNSRLDLQTQTGFDPARLSGTGDLDFRLVRPALSDAPMEDTKITVIGNVTDGGLADVAIGTDLTETSARVDFTNERITISGFGSFGPATVNFEWRDGLTDGDAPSTIAARSVVTPDILNRFGFFGRPYMNGEIPVELRAELQGSQLADSRFELDLTGARLDLAEVGWLKPPGDHATAVIEYRDTVYGRSASAVLDSDTAKLDGSAAFGEDGRLISADLNRAFLATRADIAGKIQRGDDGSLFLSVTGPFLDVSNVLPDFTSLGSTAEVASGPGADLPISIDAEVNTLQLSDEIALDGARMAAISTREGPQSITIGGELPDGGLLNISYNRADDGTARISADAGDAGGMVKTFLKADFLVGGTLAIDGVLRGADQQSDFNISIQGTRLRNAPFLTQILSLASLRGLADTLGGEGVRFSRIEIPLKLGAGRLVVDGGRASGPALGLTVNGWLDLENQGLSLDGVLVPSFGVNSALGGIPIIGDLFVGRDGEGVFSLTYSVRGELARAQVAINPLSAATPGILRRIFENPSDTDLPLPEEVPPGE